MRNIIFVILLTSINLTFSHAQHWEKVGDGVDPRYIYGLYEWNNKLAVCGGFGTIDGTSINSVGVGWWDGSSWIAETGDFSSTPPAKCFAEYQNQLYIAGAFLKINGNKYCRNIAKLDSSGSWLPLGSGITGGSEVNCMSVYNGDLYVGGQFGIVDSTVMASKIARWDGSGWHAVGSGLQGSFAVNDMTVFQNQLYVGGFFSSANGVQTSGIGRWNGVTWDSLGTGLNGPARALLADTITNRLYVGGQFTIAGGVSTPTGIAFWDGSNWFAVGQEPYVPAIKLIKYNGILYNATTQWGITNSMNDTINNICWLDGNIWRNVGAGFDAEANAFAIYQNELYIGGGFQYAGDSLVNGIVKWIPGSLGVEESVKENKVLKITPNPAKDEVLLELNLKKQTKLRLQISDINGKKIKEDDFEGNGTIIYKVNITSFVSGVYIFSVYDENELIGSEKVIIKN
ncbi:MAG: T9SS type A sorting domain-containing protein [Bacteroidetes bacterium]|nr:T9SS type A sorting domain-containing protein [Bacteroidota bacterium]